MKFIKTLLITLSLFVGISSSAIDCSSILETDGNSIPAIPKEMAWAICDNDVAMNAINLVTGDLASTSGVKAVYEIMGAPEVPKLPDNLAMSSKLFTTLISATTALFFWGILMIKAAQVVPSIIKGMTGEDATGLLKDAKTWYAAITLLVLGVLMYPVQGVMFGQLIVIGIIVLAIKVSNFLLSVFIGVFSFKVNIDERVADPNIYKDEGVQYANRLVDIMVSQLQMASTFGKINSSTTEARMNMTSANLATVSKDSVHGDREWVRDGEKRQPVTVRDYVLNAISPSVIVTFLSPVVSTTRVVAGGAYSSGYNSVDVLTAKNIAGATFKITSGQVVSLGASGISNETKSSTALSGVGAFGQINNFAGSKLLESYIDPKVNEGVLFNSVNFGRVQTNTNTKDTLSLKLLIGSGITEELTREVLNANTMSTKTVGVYANKLINLADTYVEQYKQQYSNAGANDGELTFDQIKQLKQEFIRTSQPYLLGYYDHVNRNDIEKSKDIDFAYNPKRIDSIYLSDKGKDNLLIRNLADAQRAATWFMRNKCTEFAFSDKYASQLYSEARLIKALTEDENSLMTAHDAASNHSAQCIMYNGLGNIEFLVNDDIAQELNTMLDAQKENGANDNELRVKLFEAKWKKAESYLNQTHANMNKSKEGIANHYANINAIIKLAGYLVTAKFEQPQEENANNTDLADYKILSSLREGGAMVLPSYFSRLSNLTSKLSSQFNSFDIAASGIVDLEEDTLITGIKDGVQRYNKTDIESWSGAFIPVGAALNGVKNPDVVYVPLTNDEARETKEADEDSVTFVYKLMDAIIPAQDVLVGGFGLDKPTGDSTFVGGMISCANTGKCYQFSQHPLATLTMYGQEIMAKGLVIIVANEILKALTNLKEVTDGLFDTLGKVTGQSAAAKALKYGFKGGFMLVEVALLLGTVVTDILRPFANIMVVMGIMLSFVLPLVPVVGWLLASIMWILESMMVIIFYPLLLALAFIKVNDQPILSTRKFVGLHVSVLIKPALYVSTYVFFFGILYSAFYVVNTAFGQILLTLDSADSGAFKSIGVIISMILTFVSLLYLYFKIVVVLSSKCIELPDVVLGYIGIQGLAPKPIGEAEALIGGGLLAHKANDLFAQTTGVGGKILGDKAKQRMIEKAISKDRAANQDALKHAGVDVNLNDVRDTYDKHQLSSKGSKTQDKAGDQE